MSEELETLKARIDEYGAQRELVGAYSALKADAWMDAESHAETQREGIDKLLELLKPENQEAIEKVKEAWPRITQVFNQFSEPIWETEESPGRRGTLVTDLSQLSKGDVVDCYWDIDDISIDGDFEADVTIGRDPSEPTAGGYQGFSGRNYWWDPTRHSNQEVRLIDKARPEGSTVGSVEINVVPSFRLTDPGLLPDAAGSQIRAFKIKDLEGATHGTSTGSLLVNDGAKSIPWGPSPEATISEIGQIESNFGGDTWFDPAQILEFEVIHNAGKENA